MTDLEILNTLKDFLDSKVAPEIRLQKATDKNIMNYELVNPVTHVGWIPPNGYLPEGMEAAIPCMIVGFDEGEDNLQDAFLNIRISFAVYSPGLHEPDSENGIKYTPDYQGYWDLSNLMERAKHELIKSYIVNNKVTLEGPFKWGMYQEQPHPYWYGWLTFKVNKPAEMYLDLNKYL